MSAPAIQPCGTKAAWQRHWRKGEPPCELCAKVHKPSTKKGRPVVRACGTMAGFARHKRHGEQACVACQAAHREYTRQLYLKRRPVTGAIRPYRKHNMKASQPLTWAHLAAMVRAREDLTLRLGLHPELCAALAAEAKRLGYL